MEKKRRNCPGRGKSQCCMERAWKGIEREWKEHGRFLSQKSVQGACTRLMSLAPDLILILKVVLVFP
jgi:hypothetical protein